MTDIRERAANEIEQLQLYKQVYLETNPFPEEPDYEVFKKDDHSFIEVVGIASAGFTVAAIGGIVYSAIRTAGVFVQKEVEQFEGYGFDAGLIKIIAAVASVTIMFTVEGFLAAWGYNKGKESKKLDVSYWGPGIAFFISALAGFLPSFSLLPEGELATKFQDFISYTLFVLSGFGIAALVAFGAHNVGVIHTRWIAYLEGKKAEVDKANAEKRTFFNNEVESWNQSFEEDYRKLGREALFEAGKFSIKRVPGSSAKASNKPTVVKHNVTGEIREYLINAGILPSEVGDGLRFSPVSIADALNLQGQDRANIHTILGRLRKEEADGKFNLVNQ